MKWLKWQECAGAEPFFKKILIGGTQRGETRGSGRAASIFLTLKTFRTKKAAFEAERLHDFTVMNN